MQEWSTPEQTAIGNKLHSVAGGKKKQWCSPKRESSFESTNLSQPLLLGHLQVWQRFDCTGVLNTQKGVLARRWCCSSDRWPPSNNASQAESHQHPYKWDAFTQTTLAYSSCNALPTHSNPLKHTKRERKQDRANYIYNRSGTGQWTSEESHVKETGKSVLSLLYTESSEANNHHSVPFLLSFFFSFVGWFHVYRKLEEPESPCLNHNYVH